MILKTITRIMKIGDPAGVVAGAVVGAIPGGEVGGEGGELMASTMPNYSRSVRI
jgi:outer membrane lipoprotein SlyB